MEKLIFLILAVPILIFVFYLGGSAIMRSSFTSVNAGTGELVDGSEPLVFTGLPPSLVVAM